MDSDGLHQTALIGFDQLFKPVITEFFSSDVQATVHIGIDYLAVRTNEQPSNALAGAQSLIRILVSEIGKRIEIQRRLARGIAFFANNHLDAVFLRLVANHVDQTIEGNVHEILIIDLAKVDTLFPTFVVSDNNASQIVLKTKPHNEMRNLVHHVIDAASALHELGATMSLFTMRLQTGYVLVVHGIDAFQCAPFNNHGMNPAGRRRKGDNIAKPNINKASTVAVKQNGTRTVDFIGQFNEKGVPVRNDSHVADNRLLLLSIERLIFARPNFQRWESDTIVVGKNKMAVGNLIAVTANDKGSVLLAIAGQSRHSLELARIG